MAGNNRTRLLVLGSTSFLSSALAHALVNVEAVAVEVPKDPPANFPEIEFMLAITRPEPDVSPYYRQRRGKGERKRNKRDRWK